MLKSSYHLPTSRISSSKTLIKRCQPYQAPWAIIIQAPISSRSNKHRIKVHGEEVVLVGRFRGCKAKEITGTLSTHRPQHLCAAREPASCILRNRYPTTLRLGRSMGSRCTLNRISNRSMILYETCRRLTY